MLVTRHSDTELHPWSFNSKLETFTHKAPTSPRMSYPDPPLSTAPDWQGQYSYDPHLFSSNYDHVATSSENSSAQAAQPRSAGPIETPLELNVKSEGGSPLAHQRSLDPLGLRTQKQPSPVPEQAENQADDYTQKPSEPLHEESLNSTDTPGISLGSNPLSSVSSAGPGPESSQLPASNDQEVVPKDEDDELIDDEDMLEADGEPTSQPQTAAERTAQRRKMKRFRLTHQQTRFLMSEFAKQPHPDAAHRERLSREIPGLSPRQVQVWFQNRRAKIKRLTADDRDRMIKMRAVPDDFDNVQALHSPYGAVHGLGTPMASPVDFSAPYGHEMMRPLMVDVRRPDGDDHHLSPTGLSPAFGSIGFNPSASMSNPDILSPLSPTSGDRYGYSGHHLSAPLSAGQRPSNPFARQTSLDTSMQLHGHPNRQGIRPLQPLQLREAMTRSRSDTLQSPLRTSMSWKGDSLDYSSYHHGHSAASPHMGTRPQQSLYQNDSISTPTTTLGGYDSSVYSSTVQSPTHMNYSSFGSSGAMQPNSQNRSRLRASSATLPLGLDLRMQVRGVGNGSHGHGHSHGHSMVSTAHSPTARTASTSQLGGGAGTSAIPGTSSYTASFPSAPLTAPIDFSLPRTPGGGYRPGGSGQDYSMPQMSAPINPSHDFSQAFQASLSGGSNSSNRGIAPLRDTYGTVGLNQPSQGSGTAGGSSDRHDEYGQDSHGHGSHLGPSSLKRKRSFTLPGGAAAASGPGQPYGNST